jgi:hypothetical protein
LAGLRFEIPPSPEANPEYGLTLSTSEAFGVLTFAIPLKPRGESEASPELGSDGGPPAPETEAHIADIKNSNINKV